MTYPQSLSIDGCKIVSETKDKILFTFPYCPVCFTLGSSVEITQIITWKVQDKIKDYREWPSEARPRHNLERPAQIHPSQSNERNENKMESSLTEAAGLVL